MHIRFLGTGTSTGIPEIGCNCEVCTSPDVRDNRLRASVLVSVESKNILIDCGPDFRQQILDAGTTRIDMVLITHEHYDHTAGIDDLRPFGRNGSIPIYLEKRVADLLRERMSYCFSMKKYPGAPDIRLSEIENKPFIAKGIDIQPIRAMHYNLPILGYRIGTFAYITDMLSLPECEYDKLQDVDTLVVNALRREPHISHQALSDALNLIERIAPREAYLTHMSHLMGTHDKASRLLPPHVHFAYDRLEIEV